MKPGLVLKRSLNLLINKRDLEVREKMLLASFFKNLTTNK